MSMLKHPVTIIVLMFVLLLTPSCGRPDSPAGQALQPAPLAPTVSASDTLQETMQATLPSEHPTRDIPMSAERLTFVAEHPWKDPRRWRPSPTPTPTRTPLPPGIPSLTPSPTIAERVPIDNGAGGVLIENPQLIGPYTPSNEWLLKRGNLYYVVYTGNMRDRINGGPPKHGFILKRIVEPNDYEDRLIYAHRNYLPKEEGTPRIVTAFVSDTSMQLIITTTSGELYRYDVLEETLGVITAAELTATPVPTASAQITPEATSTPFPSSEPTPLAGGAGGWMIERPWIHPHYTLSNAWQMPFDDGPNIFFAGYEDEQNWPSAPKRGVLIVGRSVEQDGQGKKLFTTVYHLPKGSGAARISNATTDGTHYQLTIQTDAGKTFLFDGGINGPQEIQP